MVAVLFLAITFGRQNSDSVTLRYYFVLAPFPAPLYLIVYTAIILGMIVGMVMSVYSRVTLKRRVKKLERANASLREEMGKIEGEGLEYDAWDLRKNPPES